MLKLRGVLVGVVGWECGGLGAADGEFDVGAVDVEFAVRQDLLNALCYLIDSMLVKRSVE
jgi:hypothetical protein